MFQLLTLEEAKEWVEKNLYEADSFIDPLRVAVKRDLLKPVNGECFAVVEHESNGCVWHLDKVWRLSNKEMEKNNLYCRYRYLAHVVSAPADYKGVQVMCAGIPAGDEKDERLKAGTRISVSGYTDELWILDYHCSVSTEGTVDVTPGKYDKKVMVTLDSIDGEGNVGVYVRKSKVHVVE